MGTSVKPTQTDLDTAKHGLKVQFDSMFDAETRTKMVDMGLDKFMDHVAVLLATDAAYLRFYANCLHPGSEDR